MSWLALLILGILATCGLVFNMVAIPLYQEAILVNQGTLSPVEEIILVGFLLILIFDISSVFWISFRLFRPGNAQLLDAITLAWGMLCLVLLLGEKAMIDEIARESRLGWETLGEWIVMYVGLTVQLGYNIFLVLRIARTGPSPSRATTYTGPPTAVS